MTNLDNKVTHIESSVARIEAEQSAQNLEDPLLDVSQDDELYKRLADYRIPAAGIICKPDVSKITQGHIRKHFIGKVSQLTSSNKEAMMDSMIKITEVFRNRLLAVWDARPNKKNITLHRFTEAARDKLATDISVFLKRCLDDIPIDMCEKNWVSLYLVYHLFEKYISTSQRDKRRAPTRVVSMYSGSYMDTASEGGSSAIMPLTFFNDEDEDDTSTAAQQQILSAAATTSRTPTTISQDHHLPSFSILSFSVTSAPSASATPSTSDPVTLMQDNWYPKQPQGNSGLSPSPSSTTSSSKRQRSKTNAIVPTNRW
ncbi:hypothetical protein INT45_011553 [Circinella minor]|uniref:Uncharacterized protein n=1 Tax=Circinella minor TaxID=1195481 RepID=A0A8H7VLE3_9FUNG|nr:hypothetical protein INT45_011553 [Circinella minor]